MPVTEAECGAWRAPRGTGATPEPRGGPGGRTTAQPEAGVHHPPRGDAEATPCHDARTLTGPGSTARVVLDGQVYTLRITRARKLILTK